MAYKQSTLPVEVVQIAGDNITPSLLVWRRYHRPAPGILEIFLDLNPHLSRPLSENPFLPVGALVYMPIDKRIINGMPFNKTQITAFGNVEVP